MFRKPNRSTRAHDHRTADRDDDRSGHRHRCVCALSVVVPGFTQANQVSTIEQAGQLVLLVIGDSLKMAGYGEIRGSNFAGRSATLMDGAYLRGCTGTTFADPFPPYNGIPPLIQTPPDLTCSVPSAGDSLYVRFQAGPVIANMLPAEEDRIRLRDCLASTAAQDQEIDAEHSTRRRVSHGRSLLTSSTEMPLAALSNVAVMPDQGSPPCSTT